MVNRWDDPGYDDDDSDGGEGKQPNPVRDRMRKLEKENKELREQTEKLLAQQRRGSVEQILTSKGYGPKVAALVPKDVEPTAEALERWLADYGEVFATAKTDDGGGDDGASEPDPEAAEQGKRMARIAAATDGAKPAGAARDQEISRELSSKDLTRDRLMDLIHSAGGGFGTG